MLNVEKIKKDYSIFKSQKDLVYLNNAATSLTPDRVVDVMSDYYKYNRSTVHRGGHANASQASKLYDGSRQKIADYLNVEFEEIIFTKSTTSSINRVAESLRQTFKPGDEIIVTNLEHHSNYLPWLVLAKKANLKLVIVEARDNKIYPEDVFLEINDKTRLIAVHHASNVLGDEVDVKKICNKAREKNILTVIDGAQAAGHLKIDLSDIKPDFYTISAHKLFGPTGLGILYINKKLHNVIEPFDYGGDMVDSATVDYTEFKVKPAPERFEGGTPSIAEIIGMGEVIDYINEIGIDNIHNHCVELKKYSIKKFDELGDRVTVYNKHNDSNLLTFNITGVPVHDAVSSSFLNNITFSTFDVYLRDGTHCNTLTTHHVLDTNATLRASFQIYNSIEDIDKLVDAVNNIYEAWQKVKNQK